MKNKNKLQKKIKKLQKLHKAVIKFLLQTFKNYKTMKTSIKKILTILIIGTAVTMTSCNVTRTMTTESQAYQRGDTAVHIVTKTTEMYNAVKNQ